MATANELRQILKEDSTGKNLYDHLTETLMRIVLERPSNAYDSFELISSDVKANPMNPDPEKGKPVPPSKEEVDAQRQWANKCMSLLKVPEEPVEAAVGVPDLVDDANAMEWAGVSFGRGETYRLYLSMKKLAETLPGDVAKLRFFGKITTRGKPYYVVEGLSDSDQEGIDESKQEGRSGANKYAYWVTHSTEATSGWVKLPNVSMAQVVTSRQFKRLLTGNLEAPVPAYPPFEGTEINLLRAIIVRIASATSISPDGYFVSEEEEVKPAEAEAINGSFPKAPSELNNAGAWKHHEVELNKLGRVKKMPEQLDANGEPIVPEEEVDVTPNLADLTPENWTFRVGPGGAGTSAGSCVVARSVVWPGAVAIATGRKFINVYVGNGTPYDPKPYSPPLFGSLCVEWAPAEEEPGLVEQQDVRADPTPPKPEGEAGGEE